MASSILINLAGSARLKKTKLLSLEEAKASLECNVQYSAENSNITDRFEYSSGKLENKSVFKSSNGESYDLKNTIEERITNVNALYWKKLESRNWFEKALDWCKSKLNIGTYPKTFLEASDECIENSRTSTKELFEKVTGVTYNRKNVEAFIKGGIKLKAEKIFEKYSGEELKIKRPTPYLASDYVTPSDKERLSKQRTELSKTEKKMFESIKKSLDKTYAEKFENALNSGKLLESNSTGSVLDSLYKILNTKRAKGLDNIKILKECLDVLANPYIITQQAEDIPKEYQNDFKKKCKETGISDTIINDNLQHRTTSTCAAASIEYNLASKYTSEFFQIIEGLTSEQNEVKKIIPLSQIAKTTSEAQSLLDKFKTPYKIEGKNVELTLKPDKHALFLAQIQNNCKDEDERSMIDVLMQSLIMQLGSRGTYNSLLDMRKSNEECDDNGGLIASEVSYINNILANRHKNVKTYQCIQGSFLKGYEADFATIRKDLLKALESNENIIIGQLYFNTDGKIDGAHEISIIGHYKSTDGKHYFVCQDSDDGVTRPVLISEEKLLPQIHHALLETKDF